MTTTTIVRVWFTPKTHAGPCLRRLTAWLVMAASARLFAEPPFEPPTLPRAIAPLSDQGSEGASDWEEWGRALAADNGRVIIGSAFVDAPFWKANGASIWEHHDEGWHRVAVLAPEIPPITGDAYGAAVDIDGDLAVVGAPGQAVGDEADAGAVHIFKRQDDGSWAPIQVITPVSSLNDHFGRSVALDGARLVVGSGITFSPGGADLFVLNERGTFEHAAALEPPAEVNPRRWGCQVAIEGNMVVVADRLADVSGEFLAGAVATFTIQDDEVFFSDLLTRPVPGQGFGTGLALDHGRLAVSQPNAESNAGAVHVFNRKDNSWILVGSVKGKSALDLLERLDLEGDRLAVSTAPFTAPGWAALYAIGSNSLEQVAEVRASSLDNQLGAATYLVESWWFVHRRVKGGFEGFSLGAYHLSDVEGDCDGDTRPNGIEVTVLHAPDCNGNLVPDECELASNDCDGDLELDTCATMPTLVPSVEGDQIVSVGIPQSGLGIFLCRIDVPPGAKSLVAVRPSTVASAERDSQEPQYVAVYRDPDQDGVPANLELLSARTTLFLGVTESFRVPVGPIEVIPGEALYVALAIPSSHESDWVGVHRLDGPVVPGRSFYGAWMERDVDFKLIGQELQFSEPSANYRCTAEFASPLDLDGDGVPDVCACTGDLDKSGAVDGADLGALLAAWGTPELDLDGDNIVSGSDLGLLLGAWGTCP